jgi:hypothetical protein
MKQDRRWILLISCTIAMLGVTTSDAEDEGARMREDFKNPPLALNTIPLWHMNGRLTKEEITAQLKASRDISGFAGVAVLPVKHAEPKYLSEEYFERYRDILETSKTLGVSVVFYDDVGFPSGTAGGKMREQFPDHISSHLDKSESTVTGPKDWKRALPGGRFMGAVATRLQPCRRMSISA